MDKKITMHLNLKRKKIMLEPYGYEILNTEDGDLVIDCNIRDSDIYISESENCFIIECYEPIVYVNGKKIIEL